MAGWRVHGDNIAVAQHSGPTHIITRNTGKGVAIKHVAEDGRTYLTVPFLQQLSRLVFSLDIYLL